MPIIWLKLSSKDFFSPSAIQIFVASINNLASLSLANLTVVHQVSTGPVRDSPFCNFDGSSCLREARLTSTDNHNKILVQFNHNTDSLTFCGSVRQGICSVYSTKDLSLISSGDVAVAANLPSASTVALTLNENLIVAASHSTDSPYRDPFPIVSIRQSPHFYVVNAGDLEGEGAVYERAEQRSTHSIRYISIFQHQHFVYLTTIENSRSRTTKLVRFCANDTRFVSYSEIELQCRSDDNYNYPFITSSTIKGDSLIATFTDSTSSKSAICVFSMQKIKLTFWYNIDRCRSGTDSIGLPHIGRDSKCTNKSRAPLDEDTCELGVGGSIEAVEMSSYTINDVITSVNMAEPSIILIGTMSGQVLLLQWKDSHLEAFRVEKSMMGGGEVKKLLITGNDILIQQPKTISLRPLAHCNHYTSCSTCIKANDPLCNWCYSTGTCTTSKQCSSTLTNVCPSPNGLPVPNYVSINESRTIFLPVRNLQQPVDYNYQCVFGKKKVNGVWNEFGISCTSPIWKKTSSVKQDVVISLQTSTSNYTILQHNFTYYDCSQLKTCSSCSKSQWKCHWCSESNSCASENTCLENKFVAKCASVRRESDDLIIPIGRTNDISISFENLESLSKNSSLSCRLKLNGTLFSSQANIHEDDKVVCRQMEIPNIKSNTNFSTSLEILNFNQILDKTRIHVYDCSHLAADCSSCSALSPIWKCQWCNGRCSIDCPTTSLQTICDRPQILSFYPNSGPMEGGTVLTINGKDLGSSLEDVQDRVTVAGSRCQVIHYVISKQIVCRLEKGNSSGPIRISIGRASKRTADSKESFTFVDVKLFSVSPLFAPLSGGTKLTFYGTNLNAGSNVSINIGDISCPIYERNASNTIICIVNASPYPQKISVISLEVDNRKYMLNTLFQFRPDPIVSHVRPLVAFESGGKHLIVEGNHLDSVTSPKMYYLSSLTAPYEIVSELSECQVLNSTRMSCLSPKLNKKLPSPKDYKRLPIGFLMNNVTSVQNLGHKIQMNIVLDPEFVPFKGVRIHHGDQPLILDGKYLSEGAEPSDYRIFIGTERCFVTLVDIRQLVCSAPLLQPSPTDENGRQTEESPLVVVLVGKLRQELGYIQYASSLNTVRLWVLVVASLAAFTLLIFMLIIFWKKRQNDQQRDYKKIQLQMEHLESNVRKECKQAFAELQTSISFTGPEDYGSIDYLSFREYIVRILWNEGGPITNPSLYSITLPLTLAQFDSLLSSKHFVFALVESAESDSSMSPSEKSVLSSLLISALLRNFHYCTEVILDLLRAHIAKMVHANESNLLFRKSESLVEKLFSKWLSICLHEDILISQGSELYRLYKALKYQVEKGPIDMITGNARYTINESKLLRESIEATTLDCLVMDLFGRGPYVVRVHSCDSITQFKFKVLDVVYKDTPYSQRPSVQQFDLEWQCPKSANVIMNDIEGCDIIKSPQRLNTLSSYGITNSSLFIMQSSKIRIEENLKNGMSDSGQCSWSSLDRSSSPLYSSNSFYHLISNCKTIEKKRKIDESIPSSIPEVYLTRLLTSKGTVQKFIDDFFESVLFLETSSYPVVLKYLFDFLDEEAVRNGVDSVLSYQWKSNCYILRLWANLINNPKILFDIAPNISVDANLTVIAQTLTDCFSYLEPIFGAHAPSSRLLFAKEVSRLRPLVMDFYRRVECQPTVNERTLHTQLSSISQELNKSGSTAALSELLAWVRGNGIRLVEVLTDDKECLQQRLPQRLSQIINLSMDQQTEHIYCTISDDIYQ
ncbi:unnamed protein product [Auanema sp. JU1783]|nr:unnamed protein product [Auanema sp. JU1783]